MDKPGRLQPTHPTAVIVVATALLLAGVVMVASASASLTESLLGPGILHTTLGRQLLFAAAGVVVMLISARLGAGLFSFPAVRRRLGHVLFVLAVGCLIAALIPGLADAHRGAQRWLRLGLGTMAFSVQPSEFAKVAMIAFLASLLGAGKRDARSLRKGFLPAAAAVGVCILLVGKEDFGTAALLASVGMLTLFVAGCRFRHLFVLGWVGAGVMAALVYAEPYRMHRLAAYRTYWDDPLGAGYQPIQSLTTIASGGFWGTGLGAGIQKYGYLPDSRTDFIFAVICEETGVLGGALVIALFGTLVWLGLGAMRAARTHFERLLALGLTATLGLQAVMHIAVVTVVTPTTGISLPLVSAGGSSLLTFCLMIGLLSAVAARGRPSDLFSNLCDEPTARARDSLSGGEAAKW